MQRITCSVRSRLSAPLSKSEKRLEETDQRLSALEPKFDIFSHEPRKDNKDNEPARKAGEYCKKTGNRLEVIMNLYACTSKETTQTQSFRTSRNCVQKAVHERVSGRP